MKSWKNVQKVWKMLKSWKNCGKVERNANNFGKKPKKVEENEKNRKNLKSLEKSKKSRKKCNKIIKKLKNYSRFVISARRSDYESVKKSMSSLTWVVNHWRLKNGVEKLSWRKIGNHQSVKNVNGLTCLSRKSLKSEKFSRKNDLCEKFIIIGMWKKWMSSLARLIIFEERKMLSKQRYMRKIAPPRTEWKSKSGQRSYPRRHYSADRELKSFRRLRISVGEIFYSYLIRIIRRMHTDFSKAWNERNNYN